jgi:dihydrofolate reductase
MGKLIYSMNVSLDGYVNSPDGGLEWAVVDDELHAWFNEQARTMGTSLYGRRMYELMTAYWQTAASDPRATPAMLEFARIWTATPRTVFSTTIDHVDWNSRLARGDVERELERVRAETDGDIDVGGPTLAAEFIRRDLVDEYRPVFHPVVLGGGTPFFPDLQRPIGLRLVETRTFASGAVYLGFSRTG